MNTVLFSAVGHSDPINAGYDGSWLHCCRWFHPDETVVYCSEEMIPYEKDRHIFSRTLEKLNQFCQTKTVFNAIYNPEMTNPQNFDICCIELEKTLNDLHNAHPDDRILVNISSGTPAMKNSLVLLYHTLPYKITLIQVNGPHGEMRGPNGERATVPLDYNVDEGWENDLDNLDGSENRTRIVQARQQSLRLRLMQLQTLIEHNEYYGASILAEELKELIPNKTIDCARAASERAQLNMYAAGTLFWKYSFQPGLALKERSKDWLFKGAETVLTMQNDLKRSDYASCVRKLTPVLFALSVTFLAKKGIPPEHYTDSSMRIIDPSILKKYHPEIYTSIERDLFSKFRKPMLDSNNLITLMNAIGIFPDAADKFDLLRRIEMNVRNTIAHKPEKLTEDVFFSQSNKRISEMMDNLRDLFPIVDPEDRGKAFWSDYWKEYETMNAFLLGLLK